MSKILIILLVLYYSIKANNEYEVIDEFIPKFIFNNVQDKIFKYNSLCGEKKNKTDIYFQAISTETFSFYIYLYDDLSKIQKDQYGFYVNYTSQAVITKNNQVIIFNNTICNKDYYFFIKSYSFDELVSGFIQVSIFNDEANIFNLSSLLSLDYTFIPRKNRIEECFYYSFNESKYALIDNNGNLKIEENGQNISISDKINIIQFKKDLEYKIYYKANPQIEPPSSPAIHFHFYNEKTYFKYNKEDFPIILFGINNESYFEINISDYKIGEYILLKTFKGKYWNIKYQYKIDFNNNNFINLGDYSEFNYIPIKKTKNDSSLLLYIKYSGFYKNLLSMIDIVKDDVMEITSDFNSSVKGPKFLFLDYYKFNGFNSFAFESNKSLSFLIQEIDVKITMDKKIYNNIYISKHNLENPLINKRIFIYLNSTDTWNFVIKKFNFSIKENDYGTSGHEYLDLCQGEEPKTELYYYKSHFITELFTSVFGNFYLYFINEGKIKALSNFDFSKINETIEFISHYEKGYLRIVCKEPAFIKHTYIYAIYYENLIETTLTSGEKYYYSTNRIPQNIKLSGTLIGKTISLKFSMFGAKNNNQIKLNINGSEYTLSNQSLEFELESNQNISSYIINFDIGKDIKEEMIIEIVVGTKEDLSEFQIKNLNETIGNLNIDKGRGVIIKVPKEYSESYYNYSIIQNNYYYYHRYYIDISYDKIEFMTLKPLNEYIGTKNNYEYSHLVPLFKVNPYSYIPNNTNKSDEKFFFILLFNYGYKDYYISIKKPKLFTEINFQKINIFPQLKGEDEKYYNKILVPKEDYDSLLIQTDPNSNISFSYSKDNSAYSLNQIILNHDENIFSYSLFKIPIDKKENKNIYLNYYGNSFSDGYISFIPGNESILEKIDAQFKLDFKISQKKKENILTLYSKSYSYYAKRPIIYYLIINEPNEDKIIFSALAGQINFDKNKLMLKADDNGESENYQTEVTINKDLIDYEAEHTSNRMIIVPVDKETNFAYMHLKTNQYFHYENSKYTYIIIIIVVIVILVLIIIIGLLYYRKKKKEISNNIECVEDELGTNERILADN